MLLKVQTKILFFDGSKYLKDLENVKDVFIRTDLTAYKMTCPSCLACASDSKNPDLYYLLRTELLVIQYSLVGFRTVYKITSLPCILAWSSDQKTTPYYLLCLVSDICEKQIWKCCYEQTYEFQKFNEIIFILCHDYSFSFFYHSKAFTYK